MPECPSCHGTVPLGRNICPFCRTSLALPCPFCGFVLPGLVRSCPRCRQRLDGPPPSPPQPPVQEPPSPPRVRPQVAEQSISSRPGEARRDQAAPARGGWGIKPAASVHEAGDDDVQPAPPRRRSWEDELTQDVAERRPSRREQAEAEPARRTRPGGVRTWADLAGQSADEPAPAQPARSRPPVDEHGEDAPPRSARSQPREDEDEDAPPQRPARSRLRGEEEAIPARQPRSRPAPDDDGEDEPRQRVRSRSGDEEEDEPPRPARSRPRPDEEEEEPARPARSRFRDDIEADDEEARPNRRAASRGARTWGELEGSRPAPGGDDPEDEPRRRRPAGRVRGWNDLPAARGQFGEEDEERELAAPRRGRVDEDDARPRARSGGAALRRDEDEPSGLRGRAQRDEASEPQRGSGDDPLSSVHGELHDFVFTGLKDALEARTQATTLDAQLEALDPLKVMAEIERRCDQLPRQVGKVLRRQLDQDLKLDHDRLEPEITRHVDRLKPSWQEVEDALDSLREQVVPEGDAQAYLEAARTAGGGARSSSGASLLGMVGRALEGPFRAGRAPAGPRRLLSDYHEALRAALQATDEGWKALFGTLADAVARAGGPCLKAGEAGGSSNREEVARLASKARALLEEHEPRKAMKVVEMGRAIDPKDPQLALLGLRIAIAARQKEEIDRYTALLEQEHPDDPEAIKLRAELLLPGGEAKAIALLEKGLSAAPDDRSLKEMLARTAFRQGDYDKALKVLKQLTQEAPREAEFHLLRARAHGFLDQAKGAMDSLKKYVELVTLGEKELADLRADEAFDCLAADDEFDRLLKTQVDLLVIADGLFSSDGKTFYFADEVPSKKLKNAQSKWLDLGDDEELVFVIDTTFLGRCTEGIAVTNERIVWKDLGYEPEQVPLDKIKLDRIKCEDGKVFIGRRSMNLNGQPNLINPLIQFLQAVARTNT